MSLFEPFPKLARLNRDCTITEKLDGTNAQVIIMDAADYVATYGTEDRERDAQILAANGDGGLLMFAGSRKRIITPGKGTDNFGFARWVQDNAESLFDLGEGRHFGEWWGKGIQRGYGLTDKRFSLFNAGRWHDERAWFGVPDIAGTVQCPEAVTVVPVLFQGPFDTVNVANMVTVLNKLGSFAAPGFMKPEGVVVFHEAQRASFKVTCENDESPKSLVN